VGKASGATAGCIAATAWEGVQEAPQGYGKGAQGYSKPVGFVKAEDGGAATGVIGDERQLAGKTTKTDEELEAERRREGDGKRMIRSEM
jgi:RNA-binding protein 25